MSKLNSLLSKRLQASSDLSKMKQLAEKSSQGNLSSFSGVFKVTPLSTLEQEKIKTILTSYKTNAQDIDHDLSLLLSISSEVKAITHQAVILHGERIKKAQAILKNYRDGAFSAWLISTYGNRQTPYNFLQYYELYQQISHSLHAKFDEMPKQAIYTLASRQAPLEKKEAIIKDYKGEPKHEILALIRQRFPLSHTDLRAPILAKQATTSLNNLKSLFHNPQFNPTASQKNELKSLLKELLFLIK